GEAFAQRPYEAPRGEVEQALAGLWAELLQLERVGRQDHFFELGGHSLLAVQLIERLRAQGLRASIRQLFAQPTVAGLALALQAGPAASQAVPPNAIPPGCERLTPDMLPLVDLSQDALDRIVAQVPGGAANVQDLYPLAPLQEGILFHHLLQTEGDPYLTSVTLAFDTRERLQAFVDALQQVIDRHDVLRTAVLWQGLPEPVQVVWRQARLVLQTPELADGDRPAQLAALADPGRHRLDLGQAPLMRGLIAQDDARQGWLLQLLLHHLVLDHTTLEQVFHEMALLRDGRGAELAPPVPFREFVGRVRLDGRAAAHQAFFRQMLDGVDQPTAPYGLMDVQGDGRQVDEAQLQLDAALSRRLRRQARRLGVGAASLFHWAWAQVLAAGSGRDDVVFGTVLLGRMQSGEGAERALGLFINTLPLRVDTARRDLRAALRDVHERLARLVDHEQVPLSLAQRCSALPIGTPLFSALLNYRHSATRADPADDRLPGWGDGLRVLAAHERSNFPFGLMVDDLGQDFLLSAQVARPIDPRHILAQMDATLSAMADALDGNGQTPARAPAWGVAAAPAPVMPPAPTVCLHTLFEQQVARTPAAVALCFGEASLSYGELNARANQLARHLRRRGVRPDDRVAICLERGLSLVVAILAVLKSGAGYVPLDPAYPAQRLAFVLRDCAPVAVLTEAGTADLLDPAVPRLLLDAVDPPWAALADSDLDAHLDSGLDIGPGANGSGPRPHHLAYVIYTSGSTGTPKGVLVEHRQVTRLFSATAPWFGFGADDVWTLFHSCAFDFSVWEIWGALLHGGRLVVVPQALTRSPEDFYRLVCREGVTVLNQTPSAFRPFMAAQASCAETHALRHVVFGGEALQVAMLAPWFARNGERTRLVNMYGITETTVHVSGRALTPADVERGGSPIGEPIPDLSLHVLDAQGRPTPPGIVGEIHVGGAGVARGYLNRPELDAQRFIADPKRPGERLYRSGDLARRTLEGELEFVGRNDGQVKIRGFRIELGEIEAQLLQQPELREAVVLALGAGDGDVGGAKLVAYGVPHDGMAAPDPAVLRERLARVLPEHMLPAHVQLIERLPLTVQGKLDVAALPAPQAQHAPGGYVAPRTPTERALAAIWAEVLQLDRIGVHDNFFALGGDSMRTIAIVSRARERGLALAIEQIFRHLCVAGIAAELDGPPAPPPPDAQAPTEAGAYGDLSLCPAVDRERLPDGVEDAYALTQLQLGMVFHNQMSADASVYHDVFSHHLRVRDWDAECFQAALDLLSRRHELLRTAFDLRHYSQPLQLVYRDARVVARLQDLGALDRAAQDRRIAQWLEEERRQPFAPDERPLLRVFVHGRGGDHLQLTLSFHHAILDGWSVASLVTELFQVYADLRAGRPVNPAPLASRFRDAVAQERALLRSAPARAFWQTQLAGHTVGRLPPHDGTRRGEGHEGGEVDEDPASRSAAVPLSAETARRLGALARALNLPLRALLLAAHLRVMSVFSGEEDVLTGVVSHARPATRDGDKVLGLFLNTLPLRLALAGGSWRSLIDASFRAEMALMPYRAYPYARIVQDNGRRPLFETAFNFVNFHVYGDLGRDASLEFLGGTAFEATNHALSVNAALQGDALQLSVQRDPARLSAAQARRIAEALGMALDAMARDPEQDYRAADLLSDPEREQLLRGWNRTRQDYRQDLCVHELFEHQAQQTPRALALQA
ncbi:amino acid adenylation domain-containing protein, partial [Pelomonas sp. CA6]|uniref:non-ribosomal peptide synthetase n=1 Tax=Pelomonas sp. CA6 TaxID=2907999 RepID=UPI001F4BDCDD